MLTMKTATCGPGQVTLKYFLPSNLPFWTKYFYPLSSTLKVEFCYSLRGKSASFEKMNV